MKARGKEYVRYLDLSEKEQWRIDRAIAGQNKKHEKLIEPEPELTVPDNDTYYLSKANQTETVTHPMMKPVQKIFDPLSDQDSFIKILREYDCEIPEEILEDILDILMNTTKFKDMFATIIKNDNQQAIFDLEQILNVTEKKLQRDWEHNGFQEIDDIKFKGFLTWRRALKEAIFFWKKLYQTNILLEIQKIWSTYTQDSSDDKILLTENKTNNLEKRFQITTESISTILNTRKPFTRVFRAVDAETAYNMFKQWMEERNLHEDKSKTTIVELTNEGEDPRKK